MKLRLSALLPPLLACAVILLFVFLTGRAGSKTDSQANAGVVQSEAEKSLAAVNQISEASLEITHTEKAQGAEQVTEQVLTQAKAVTMSEEDSDLLQRRQQFTAIAPEPVQFSKSALERLFSANKGDDVELPTEPPLNGTVTHNFVHETGGRGFGVQLRDVPASQFAVDVDQNGNVKGHLMQDGNPEAFTIEEDANADSLIMAKTMASNIVCISTNKNSVTLGIPPADDEGVEEGKSLGVIPILNSRPGATRVIYLDFDGEVVENTSWLGGNRIDAQPWGDDASIAGIFAVIAEDFATFNVNVTTDRAVFDAAPTNRRCMAIFTPTKDAAPSAGGVAYLNSFGSAVNYMCWVYNRGSRNAGETGSHEVGHQLGLRHDGRNANDEVYYRGHTHAATNVRWGAIMGASFGQRISHWSKGEYLDANRTEDDLAEIQDYLPRLIDDHGNSRGAATAIPTGVSEAFSTGGIITESSDADFFRLNLNKAGDVTVNADPIDPTYTNLDIVLQVVDSSGNVLQSHSPEGPFDASITLTNLPVGDYYINVRGGGLDAQGFANLGYNDYSSIGPYTLTGAYPYLLRPGIPEGVTATDGTSTDNVFVSWNSTSDTDGYRIYRNQNNDSTTATQIADVTTTSLTDTTALHNVTYYYWVVAYNVQGDSEFSSSDTGYRRLPLPESPSGLTASDGASTAYTRLNWGIANFAYEYEVYRNTTNSTSGGTLLATTSSTTYDDTTGAQGTNYYYYAKSVNPEGESGFSNVNSGYRRIPPPATPTGVSATDGSSPTETAVTWNSVPLAASYYVYRNTTNTSNGAINIGGTTGALTYSDTTGVAGAVYYYFVRALNDQGFSGFSGGNSGFRQPVAPITPSGTTASRGDFQNTVRVIWEPTDDTLEYRVYRNLKNSFEGATFLQRQPRLIYYDNTAESGRTYYYFVVATNAVGSSDPSAPVVGYVGEEDEKDDEYENNDIFQNAHSLKSMEDEWLSSDDGEGIANDTDWYEVKSGSDGSRIDVIVSHLQGEDDLEIALYDAQGNEVAAGDSEENAQVLSYDGVSPLNSYYLVVRTVDGVGIPYDVTWSSLRSDESGLAIDSGVGFNPAAMRGVGFTNSSGARQTISHISKSKFSRSAFFEVKNTSAIRDEVVTRGTPRSRKFAVSYMKYVGDAVENVTASVVTSGESTVLPPQGDVRFLTRISPVGRVKKKHLGGRFYQIVSSESATDLTAADTNRFHVVKLRKRKRRR